MIEGKHPPDDELQSLADGAIDPDKGAHVRAHLEECPSCAARSRDFAALDRLARSLPLQRAGASLTRAVMQRLGSDPGTSRAFRLLLYAPPVLGLTMVVGAMLGGFVVMGVREPGPPSPTVDAATHMVRSAGDWIGREIQAALEIVTGLLPFELTRGTLMIGAATVAVFALLVLFDRTMGRRILQKAR